MAYSKLKRAFDLGFSQHQGAQIEDKSQDTLQVIGAGLPRTGTSSLKAALELLGFNPCHHMAELFECPEKVLLFADLLTQQTVISPEESKLRSHRLQRLMRGYLATVDSPGCDVYEDLMALYPKAKVILSVRDSDEAWWKSFSSTLALTMTTRYLWLTYPVPLLRCNSVLVRAISKKWMRLAGTDTLGPNIHTAHNKHVQSNVPREKLLTYNVKMGWKPLCEFLEVPIPEEPFPHVNDAATMSSILKRAQLMGACIWLLYLGLAFPLIFSVIWPQYLLSLVRDFGKVFGMH